MVFYQLVSMVWLNAFFDSWCEWLNSLLLISYQLNIKQLDIISLLCRLRKENPGIFYSDIDLSFMKHNRFKSSYDYQLNRCVINQIYNFDESLSYIIDDEKDLTYYAYKYYPLFFNSQLDAFKVYKQFKNIQARKKRCLAHVNKLIKFSSDNNLQPIFATFTLKDEFLSFPLNSYLRKLKKLFKSNNLEYIINVDFGEQNERLHFHCLLSDRIKDVILWASDLSYWGYGSINVEKVRFTRDFKKLNNYINKLSNHALKDSNKQRIIVYSRFIDNIKSLNN